MIYIRVTMTVKQLIDRLSKYPIDSEIMVLDGFNGGGELREINLGPFHQTITKKNADDGADCEGKVGKKVVVIGYGCY